MRAYLIARRHGWLHGERHDCRVKQQLDIWTASATDTKFMMRGTETNRGFVGPMFAVFSHSFFSSKAHVSHQDSQPVDTSNISLLSMHRPCT